MPPEEKPVVPAAKPEKSRATQAVEAWTDARTHAEKVAVIQKFPEIKNILAEAANFTP